MLVVTLCLPLVRLSTHDCRPLLRLERDNLHHSIPWLSNAFPVGYQLLEPQECITDEDCALFWRALDRPSLT